MKFSEIWVYLSATPLLGLTVTLVAYQLAFWIYTRLKLNPLANPVAISVALVAAGAIVSVATVADLAGGRDPTGIPRSRIAACEPVIVKDPGVRASFARFDRHQSAAARRICEPEHDRGAS